MCWINGQRKTSIQQKTNVKLCKLYLFHDCTIIILYNNLYNNIFKNGFHLCMDNESPALKTFQVLLGKQ